MLRKRVPAGTIKINTSYPAQPIEAVIRKAIAQGEPIGEGVPALFPPDEGTTAAEHDIRTDKFDVAMSSLDKVQAARTAKGDGAAKKKAGQPGPSATEDKAPKKD